MEYIVSSLGIDFLDTSARKAVMKRPRPGNSIDHHEVYPHFSHDRNGPLCLKPDHLSDDDDTMSTLSFVSSSDSSLDSRGPSVSFAKELVTAIYYRPRTTLEDKSKLFYRDAEYREFRYEYIYGRRQRKRVNFSSTLVSEVWAYECEGEKTSLYYNQSDIQR